MIDELVRRFALDAGTVASVVLPIYHTTALNTQLLPTVFAGGRAVVSSSRWLMGRIHREILDSGATFVTLVNELLRPGLEEMRRRGLPPANRVAEVQLAGSTARPRHLEMARELFPAARIHRCYGLTEAIRVAMIASDEAGFDGDASGRALPGQEIEIRRTAERRTAGEIWVRGPSVMLGYLEGGEATPLEAGWLATGDLGHLTADGRLLVEGRGDRVFKSYGHRIAPAEIEGAALALPAVAEAHCIPVPCPARGRRPVLFLEPAEPLDNGQLAAVEAALLGRLDPYKVPKDVVVVEALPRSAAGKVDLAALDRLWEELPGAAELGSGPAGCRFTGLGAEDPERSP
jgi:acyl-CoA synthetase (AMP-forming)/AMP-acid ligase II